LGIFIGFIKREVMGKEEYRIVGTDGNIDRQAERRIS